MLHQASRVPPARRGRENAPGFGPLLASALVLAISLMASHALAFGLDLWSDQIGAIWLALIVLWTGSVSSWLARGRRALHTAVAATGALGVAIGVAGFHTGFTAGMMMLGALTLALLIAVSLPLTHAGVRPFAIPIALFGAGALSMLVGGWLQAQVSPTPEDADPPERQLAYMQSVDQEDRRAGLTFLDSGRDAARLRRVETLDAAGMLRGPVAKWRAALIYQHGKCPRHFRRAFELASAAALHGVMGAPELARAAEDRWLLSTGRPQRHGTQLLQTTSSACLVD